MKPGMTVSCIGHGAALLAGILAISAHPMEAPPVATLPVSFISEKDFTQMTQGVKNAPQLKIDQPKPLADKVDAPKPVDQIAPKAADKPQITTDSSKPKTDPKPDPKPDPKQADKANKPQPPEYKPDQIADLLKKDATKTPPKPPIDNSAAQKQDAPKFDANQIAQLLDKRDPQRQLAAAETLNQTPNLGAANGAPGAQLSQSEIDALRARMTECWSPPPGIDANTKVLCRAPRSVQTGRFLGAGAGFGRSFGVGVGSSACRERSSVPCWRVSRSQCSSPSITTNGKTLRSTSILMNLLGG